MRRSLMGMSAEWIMFFFCKQTKGYLTKDKASEAGKKRFGFHFWSICTWFHWLIKREGTNPCTKMHSPTIMTDFKNPQPKWFGILFYTERISVSETFKQSVLNVLITQKLWSFGRLVPSASGQDNILSERTHSFSKDGFVPIMFQFLRFSFQQKWWQPKYSD